MKPSKEPSFCLLLFSINKAKPGEKGPSAGFGPGVSLEQMQNSDLHLSSLGRRQEPEKRSDCRTCGKTAEEVEREGVTAVLS